MTSPGGKLPFENRYHVPGCDVIAEGESGLDRAAAAGRRAVAPLRLAADARAAAVRPRLDAVWLRAG